MRATLHVCTRKAKSCHDAFVCSPRVNGTRLRVPRAPQAHDFEHFCDARSPLLGRNCLGESQCRSKGQCLPCTHCWHEAVLLCHVSAVALELHSQRPSIHQHLRACAVRAVSMCMRMQECSSSSPQSSHQWRTPETLTCTPGSCQPACMCPRGWP